jgi:hypothetical protein
MGQRAQFSRRIWECVRAAFHVARNALRERAITEAVGDTNIPDDLFYGLAELNL